MNRWSESSVTRELEVELLAPGRAPVAVQLLLHYELVDPFAVTASFRTTRSRPVTWVFARDLLAVGLDSPTGPGDVRIWPDRRAGRDQVCVSLSASGGEALLRLPFEQVADFLSTTYILCVPGEESEHLDTDAAIASLLAS
jgi:Streptomyces sporulation and cell division protein, SsgA